MEMVNVNGTNVTTSVDDGGSTQYVAIDTGTTLIGGPRDIVGNLYAQVEGAQAATGRYTGQFQSSYAQLINGSSTEAALAMTGYYSYPCEHDVEVSLTFGGIVSDNLSSSLLSLSLN